MAQWILAKHGGDQNGIWVRQVEPAEDAWAALEAAACGRYPQETAQFTTSQEQLSVFAEWGESFSLFSVVERDN